MPDDDVIRALSKTLRQALGVSLFGIDIIINNQTGQHAVIDINAFPGKSRLLHCMLTSPTIHLIQNSFKWMKFEGDYLFDS